MNDNNNKNILANLLDQVYLEVIPTHSILDRLVHIPRHSLVGISCSPAHGIEPTLELAENLRALPDESQLKVIPHIAARMIRDKTHLGKILARLKKIQVESVFVPGGDRTEPIGTYSDSLKVLQDMADIGHDIKEIGVATYPEKHPLISADDLMWYLNEKQRYATYLVTQMCFDTESIINWLKGIRAAGITLPARIGLPSVANMARLTSLSMQIGVGQSLKQLGKQKGLLKKIISTKPYQPDDLLEGLRPHLGDQDLIISGFHLFSFNDVERTETWRAETFEKFNN